MSSGQSSPIFVVLALVVAVFGSWTALDLFRRARTHVGGGQMIWLVGAAVAMGCSIWSAHFLTMLGFDAGSAGRYDANLTFLSLVLVVSAASAAFYLASRPAAQTMDLLAAGAAMGAGICMMHYVGMAASNTVVSRGYSVPYVALSLGIAVTGATTALIAARRESSEAGRVFAAIGLGVSGVVLHFLALEALRLVPAEIIAGAGISTYALGLSVTGGALLVLFLALVASLYDQRGDIMQALSAGGVGYWELHIRSGALSLSARAKQILGVPPNAAVTLSDLDTVLHPDDRVRRRKLVERAVRLGGDFDDEYRLAGGDRYINLRGQVISSGRGRRLVGVVLDVSDRREAVAVIRDNERRQRVLINELNHRVKNTLATIQSLAAQTAKGVSHVDDYRTRFEARLLALSSTHDALTRTSWQQASLRELIEHELRPFGPERAVVSGEPVELTPKQALAFGMVLHELVTNAAKYGALSVPPGLVHIVWTVTPDRRLQLRWREVGGPPVSPPSRRGFGSRLIKGSIVHELGGRADQTFEPDGLVAEFEAPLGARTTAEAFDF